MLPSAPRPNIQCSSAGCEGNGQSRKSANHRHRLKYRSVKSIVARWRKKDKCVSAEKQNEYEGQQEREGYEHANIVCR